MAVSTEENSDDLGVVEVALGEERPEGTIDHPACKNLLFGGATFPAEVASRNAADGGSLFLVLDGKGEEVLAVFDFGGGDGGDDDDRFAHGDEGGAIGEFGEFAGFDVEVAIAHAGGQGFMVVAHSCMGESRQSMSQKEESLGTGEEFRESARVGFRGHRGGQGACVVSSAQLGLVRSSRSEGLNQLVGGSVYFLSFSFSRRERYRLGSVR